MLLTLRAPEGYSVEREGAHAVALDLAIDEDLRREGRAREIVHAVQNARKTRGLQVEDRIELALDGDAALLEAARGAPRLYRRQRRWRSGCVIADATTARRGRTTPRDRDRRHGARRRSAPRNAGSS